MVGPGGAGKSTFARELGRRTGLPVVPLDRHYWKPGWSATPREDWAALQAQLLAGDGWIAGLPGARDAQFLRWIWRYPADSRPRLGGALDRHRAHLQIVELRSRRAAAAFLDGIARPRQAAGA